MFDGEFPYLCILPVTTEIEKTLESLYYRRDAEVSVGLIIYRGSDLIDFERVEPIPCFKSGELLGARIPHNHGGQEFEFEIPLASFFDCAKGLEGCVITVDRGFVVRVSGWADGQQICSVLKSVSTNTKEPNA